MTLVDRATKQNQRVTPVLMELHLVSSAPITKVNKCMCNIVQIVKVVATVAIQ